MDEDCFAVYVQFKMRDACQTYYFLKESSHWSRDAILEMILWLVLESRSDMIQKDSVEIHDMWKNGT